MNVKKLSCTCQLQIKNFNCQIVDKKLTVKYLGIKIDCLLHWNEGIKDLAFRKMFIHL